MSLPESSLRVESVLADTNAPLRDIKDPVSWPGPFPWWAVALAVVVLLAVLAALLAVYLVNRPRKPPPLPKGPPPHEVALRALRELLARGWIEEGAVEPFYVAVSNIARSYIEDRFHLRAPEQTTEEFIREASRSHALSAEHQDLVGAFLTQCDLVKFARHRPGPDDMKAAYAAAERLVMETRPPEAGP
jgi:hypothetical protein